MLVKRGANRWRKPPGRLMLGLRRSGRGSGLNQDGCAHGFYQLVRCAGVVDSAAVDFKFGDIVGQNACAHALQQFLGGFGRSASMGTFFKRKVPEVSRPAHISGRAAFFAPDTMISPLRGPLAEILSLSTGCLSLFVCTAYAAQMK